MIKPPLTLPSPRKRGEGNKQPELPTPFARKQREGSKHSGFLTPIAKLAEGCSRSGLSTPSPHVQGEGRKSPAAVRRQSQQFAAAKTSLRVRTRFYPLSPQAGRGRG